MQLGPQHDDEEMARLERAIGEAQDVFEAAVRADERAQSDARLAALEERNREMTVLLRRASETAARTAEDGQARLPNGRTYLEEIAWLYEALSMESIAKDEAQTRLAALLNGQTWGSAATDAARTLYPHDSVGEANARASFRAGTSWAWNFLRSALAEAEGRAALSSLELESEENARG